MKVAFRHLAIAKKSPFAVVPVYGDGKTGSVLPDDRCYTADAAKALLAKRLAVGGDARSSVFTIITR